MKKHSSGATVAGSLAIVFALLSSQNAFCSPGGVQVRLKTQLTSFTSKVGDRFECAVISPFVVHDQVLIPQGSTVHGHIGRIFSVGLGIRHERARLDLIFDDFVTPDGQIFPLKATLASIDNAREEVTPTGSVRGVIVANQPNELLFGVWHLPSMSLFSRSLIGLTGLSHEIWKASATGPLGAGGMIALRFIVFRFPDPEIHYNPGTDMFLRVNTDRQQGVAEAPAVPMPAPPEIAEFLVREPFAIDRRDKRPVGDIVNTAFLGSREQLVQSFKVAGWMQADPSSRRTLKQTYYAFNAMRAYAAAPVSALFYKGMLPELVFEKSLNTITKRHHIRVWYAGVVDGKELWLGAATHDTGLAFKARGFRFTHKIDANIDEERDKVTTDLRFAGCVEPEMRVERRDAAMNARAHASTTDGAAMVLPLKDCQREPLNYDPNPKSGTPLSRLLRRMILESRNHILRENPYYWTYQLARQRFHRGTLADAR